MIHTPKKRYQVVFWETENRADSVGTVHADFESLEQARLEFEAQVKSGHYRSGILMEWHKISGEWDLVEMFPPA